MSWAWAAPFRKMLIVNRDARLIELEPVHLTPARVPA